MKGEKMNLSLQKIFAGNFLMSAIILVCCFTGCQKGLRVEMVEGVVTFEGKPVSDADVCFTPKSADSGIPAMGKTNAMGKYRLTSAQGGEFGKGAVAGEYEVRVIKFLDLDIVTPTNQKIEETTTSADPRPKIEAPLANPKHHLPEKYADVKTSGLTANLKKGKNIINFDLKN
jgi:hypothetical protein